jgi:hypothetical protein
MNYVEVMIDATCNSRCNENYKCIDYFPVKNTSWNNMKDTIKKWHELIEFDNFGISGGEPLLNSEISTWISGLRGVLPNCNIILISDGRKLRELSDVVNQLIQAAPSRLCIVLGDDWEDILYEVSEVLSKTNFRFITRNLSDPNAGINFILVDKDKKFDVELYKHAPSTIRTPITDQSHYPLINPDLFRICEMRKSTPLLADEYLFRCRNSARLWYSLKGNVKANTDSTSLTTVLIKGSIIHYEDDRSEIQNFLDHIEVESRICDFCKGCIECVVHRKE